MIQKNMRPSVCKDGLWLHGVPKNVGNVLRESVMQTVSYARMVFLSVADMLSGRFGLADISGPVGAVSYVSQAVKTSAYSALRLMAILTINVGLFNLFPIPALDGWRLFLLVGEGFANASCRIRQSGSLTRQGWRCCCSLCAW